MRRWLNLALPGIAGLIVGVGLMGYRAFPSEDMVARATCASCHDVHGSVTMDEAPFQSQIWILGDVPQATYLFVNELFPYARQEMGTAISVPELLEEQGASDWARVAIESLDGGIVILERSEVTEQSLLVPYLEGVRFMDQNQHQSTWLKGIRWIIVEGLEASLQIDEEWTSMGRLLMQNRTTVVAEGGYALFRSPLDGRTYRGDYARTYTGASLGALLDLGRVGQVVAENSTGTQVRYAPEDLLDAVIATVDGRPALVLPNENRRRWMLDLTRLRAER